MAMDVLRSCYTSKQAIYRDRPDVLVDGVWRWCVPGAEPLPFPHLYGSSNYDWDKPTSVVLGEVYRPRPPWFKGEPHTALSGLGYCGTEDHFTKGGLYSERGSLVLGADGLPLCCPRAAVPLQGDADSGTSPQTQEETVLGTTGDADDGTAFQAGARMSGFGVLVLPRIPGVSGAAVVSLGGLRAMLDCYLSAFDPGFRVVPFTNDDYCPEPGSTFGDFEIPGEEWLLPFPLPDFGPATNVGDAAVATTVSPVSWTRPAGSFDPVTLYGYFVTDDGGNFYFGACFDEPVTIDAEGEGHVFFPTVLIANGVEEEE